MFKPQYKLTVSLVKNINAIERTYGQLEGMKAPQSLLLNLERDNLIRSSHASNSIEGNPLSLPEVTNLLLSDRTPVNRDEKEVKNYFEILKSLDSEVGAPFNLRLVLKIHEKLMTGVRNEIAGQVRNKGVVVGKRGPNNELLIKHNPPCHAKEEIEQYLNDLLSWLGNSEDLAVLKAGIFHHQFVYVHPFLDGNGRTCRLLTALIFLKNRYLINKYFVLDDYYDVDREKYSDSLHSADMGDATKWLEYFTEGVKYSLQSALIKIEDGLTRMEVDTRPTRKEKAALEVIKSYREATSTDLSRELKVSRQQAFNLLKSLVEKGYILKIGTTKNSYYIMK
jgi:Fic family protein